MPTVQLDLPETVLRMLNERAKQANVPASSIAATALAEHFGVELHTLFQISISGALVAGVYAREVSVEKILEHGNFGLGTFAELDGEMVVLDGLAYQVKGSGVVSVAGQNDGVPFAVVTQFSPGTTTQIGPVPTFAALEQACDALRTSGNIFYALRLDGQFDHVRTRAVNPPQPGTRLADATKDQSEFDLEDVAGTLVGIWSPGFSSAFSVAGYHFHFLSEDRLYGGHVLDVSATSLRIQVEALTHFHLALPESESYLKADLSKNTADELAYAEKAH